MRTSVQYILLVALCLSFVCACDKKKSEPAPAQTNSTKGRYLLPRPWVNRPQMDLHPNILGNDHEDLIYCWYVEEDGKGYHGYASFGGSRASVVPDGEGLFTTIEALRDRIAQQKVKPYVLPFYDSEVEPPIKIRRLTIEELKVLEPVIRGYEKP